MDVTKWKGSSAICVCREEKRKIFLVAATATAVVLVAVVVIAIVVVAVLVDVVDVVAIDFPSFLILNISLSKFVGSVIVFETAWMIHCQG